MKHVKEAGYRKNLPVIFSSSKFFFLRLREFKAAVLFSLSPSKLRYVADMYRANRTRVNAALDPVYKMEHKNNWNRDKRMRCYVSNTDYCSHLSVQIWN